LHSGLSANALYNLDALGLHGVKLLPDKEAIKRGTIYFTLEKGRKKHSLEIVSSKKKKKERESETHLKQHLTKWFVKEEMI
jgi:hypothetical protein